MARDVRGSTILRSTSRTRTARSTGGLMPLPFLDVMRSPALWSVIRIQCFLDRTQCVWDVLKVDANPRPRREPTAHRVDEYVGRFEMGRSVGMTGAPALQPGEGILFLDRPANLDQRMLRSALSGGLDTRRLPCLLLVLRRPGCVSHPLLLVTFRQLEQGIDRTRMAIDVGMTIANLTKATRHRLQVEILRLALSNFAPGQGRGYARIRLWPHRVSARDCPILRVLVVIEEDAMPLFLPPFARRQRWRTPLDFSSEGQRRTADLAKRPSAIDANVDMNAATLTSLASQPGRSLSALIRRQPRRRGPAAI